MTKTVKSFLVSYNPINRRNVFTSGDYVTGQVTLEVAKFCEIDLLTVKLKGKAEITKNNGDVVKKMKFFSFKKVLSLVGPGRNTVDKGCHVYPFTFQIPEQDLPSSFRRKLAKIEYLLEANLSRWMSNRKAKTELTVLQKRNLNSEPELMIPQQRVIQSCIGLFTSGTVAMKVNIQRTGYYQGEGIQVVASILNKTSHDIKPKYCLYSKYRHKGNLMTMTKKFVTVVGDPIQPSAGQTVTGTITIPPTMSVSISNCDIIKVEHMLRVSLGVKNASDPEIQFPIVILPELQGPDDNLPASNSNRHQAPLSVDMLRGTSFLQNPTASGPSAPPLAYGTPSAPPPAYGTPSAPPPAYGTPSAPPSAYGTPSAPPPAYGTHEMYPAVADFYGKS